MHGWSSIRIRARQLVALGSISVLVTVAALVVSAGVASATPAFGDRGSFGFESWGVDCTGLGECTAIGSGSFGQPAYAVETGGVWGDAIQRTEPSPGGIMAAISCVDALNCTAVGSDGALPTYITETNGVWSNEIELPAPGGDYAQLSGVSCWSAGNCTAVGLSDGLTAQPFSVEETNGVWGPITDRPIDLHPDQKNAAYGQFTGVSCSGPGDCTAVGIGDLTEDPGNEGIYATETDGVWAPTTVVPGTWQLYGVSCVSAGTCTAVGTTPLRPGIYVTMTDGAWGTPTEVPNSSVLMSVSCLDATNCVAVGDNSDPSYVIETNGTWGDIVHEGDIGTYVSVSCVTTSYCVAVGGNGLGSGIYESTQRIPDPATNVSATPGNGTATLTWSAPTANGGANVSGYVVTPYLLTFGGLAAQTPIPFASTATTQTITGLSNGRRYAFAVAARNAIGTGSKSDQSAQITIGAPLAPTNVTATAGSASATVKWSAPSSNNGSPIGGYVIIPMVDGVSAENPRPYNSNATTETVTGLSKGTHYTFVVAATNGRGTGPTSTPSNSVAPK